MVPAFAPGVRMFPGAHSRRLRAFKEFSVLE
jgi:hypothetical protein